MPQFLTEWKTHIAIALAIAFIAFGGGFYAGTAHDGRTSVLSVFANENGPSSQGKEIDMSAFWQSWEILDEKFVPTASSTMPSEQERVYSAIDGLTKAYNDPYTTFLPPQENKVFEEDISGNFEGVGMEIGIRDEILTVVSPLSNTPAERAGLMSGDKIVSIDGKSTQGMSVERAVQLIRGEKGTDVVLTIKREGRQEPFDVSVTRDTIQIPTIDTRQQDGVFIIKIHNFSAIASGLFKESLREFVESGTNDLVIDLRNNPGGYLDASIEMASWFLPAGKAVVTEDFGEEREGRVHRSRGYDVFTDQLDLAILVNGGSASASEILAGALSEHGVATLVGSKTFGKGSVQELVEITDETSLKVTVARWVTPGGTVISNSGITPDISVTPSEEDAEQNRDVQLRRAIEHLKANR